MAQPLAREPLARPLAREPLAQPLAPEPLAQPLALEPLAQPLAQEPSRASGAISGGFAFASGINPNAGGKAAAAGNFGAGGGSYLSIQEATIIILDLDSLLFGVLSHILNKTDCKSLFYYM